MRNSREDCAGRCLGGFHRFRPIVAELSPKRLGRAHCVSHGAPGYLHEMRTARDDPSKSIDFVNVFHVNTCIEQYRRSI